MSRKVLVNGTYDTCPTHGPQVYMSERQVTVKDGIVTFTDKEYCDQGYSVSSFFDVNNFFDKETKQSSRVIRDLDSGDYIYFVED